MDKVAVVTVFVFQNTVNGALHCSYMQTVCTNEVSGVGYSRKLSLLCSYCKGGRRVPAYSNKAAARENGLSGLLTFPYI